MQYPRWVFFVGALVSGCSTVGPGLANHPLDCAIGIKWADCLPGTAGYNNGGGQKTRADQLAQENDGINNQFRAINESCINEYRAPEFDLIRQKVEFFRKVDGPAPPFEIASNDTFPTAAEKVLIAKWATIRDGCIRRAHDVAAIPESASPMQVAFIQQERSFGQEGEGRIAELIVALYQQKLTYGEFATKRYEIGREAVNAERQFREATLIADQERQRQAQQLAQQQFQNNMMAWSVYMQSVAARQPQTVFINNSTHCTSQRFGNTVNTDCH